MNHRPTFILLIITILYAGLYIFSVWSLWFETLLPFIKQKTTLRLGSYLWVSWWPGSAPGAGYARFNGKTIVNVVPFPTIESTHTRPWWFSTIDLTMASPSPVPDISGAALLAR